MTHLQVFGQNIIPIRRFLAWKTLPFWLHIPNMTQYGSALRDSETPMPKIKVIINRLTWNVAWVIIAINACLMQTLSLVAFLFLEIWRFKISLSRREQVIDFRYLPLEIDLTFTKNELLCPESFFSNQNWPPTSISTIFKQRKIFSFSKFLRHFDEKRATAIPLIDKFCSNLTRTCLKDKNYKSQSMGIIELEVSE